MHALTVPAILAAAAGVSTTLLVIGLVRPNRRSPVRERLEAMGQAPPERATTSLARRAFVPILFSGGEWLALHLPDRILRRLALSLERAGLHISLSRFLTWWAALVLLLPLALLLTMVATGSQITARSLLALATWSGLGLLLGWIWLQRRGRKRVDAIDHALPDAIDLIVTNVEAGVGLQAAIINVAQKSSGPVAEEFNRLVREISLGRSNQEALDAMARRSGSRELSLFARSIAQAERNGVPISRVLRSHAAELRERRQQQARERANTFPLRITLLTVVFMFPTLFLLILGPIVLGLVSYFQGGHL